MVVWRPARDEGESPCRCAQRAVRTAMTISGGSRTEVTAHISARRDPVIAPFLQLERSPTPTARSFHTAIAARTECSPARAHQNVEHS
jgi:hypothetical protein